MKKLGVISIFISNEKKSFENQPNMKERKKSLITPKIMGVTFAGVPKVEGYIKIQL